MALRALLRQQIWLLPLVFTLVVGGVGWYSQRSLEVDLERQLASQLETVLRADLQALDVWLRTQRGIVANAAEDAQVRSGVPRLIEAARAGADPREGLLASPERASLEALLRKVSEAHGYTGFRIVDRFGIQLAAANEAQVGGRLDRLEGIIDRAYAGETIVSRPIDFSPAGSPEVQPLMLAIAPIRDAAGEVVAVLGFGIDARKDFTEILSVARMGETGETYAFDADGVMLSTSRFGAQLVEIGLVPSGVSSSLRVEVRDPGGDFTAGFTTDTPLRARPLTRAAAAAVAGETGVDVSGYRDYRGVSVVGAWTWLADLEMGITSEIDAAEAFGGLRRMRQRNALVLGLLVAASLGMMLYSLVIVRMRRKVERAERLGSYRIEQKIGEGGMGKVYRAHHALLRRPTAIKLIHSADAKSEQVQRFKREVEATSSLTHPNTIAIYDFGFTPEGIFYYAMEYLEGITVARCVETDGAQPEARVIHLLRQACGSIAEAHASGLIHRDLKPSNLMLCQRGGMLDFVKVLDFGLCRQQGTDLALTRVDALTGTPLYLAPEALENPEAMDARSDIYQLGAIGYYLLTGRHVFSGATVIDVLDKHLNATPLAPSEVLKRSVSGDLEALLLACLEKKPGSRPESAAALLVGLERCADANAWSQADARAWWDRWLAAHPADARSIGASGTSVPSSYEIDLDQRSS